MVEVNQLPGLVVWDGLEMAGVWVSRDMGDWESDVFGSWSETDASKLEVGDLGVAAFSAVVLLMEAFLAGIVTVCVFFMVSMTSFTDEDENDLSAAIVRPGELLPRCQVSVLFMPQLTSISLSVKSVGMFADVVVHVIYEPNEYSAHLWLN